MKIFVTGASGWIGSATTRELLDAGHQVLGLARSQESADKVTSLGAEVLRGSLEELDTLRAGAEGSDGVVHLGYVHDFARMDDAAVTDRGAIETFGAVLTGTGGPLVIASGTLGLTSGGVGTEDDSPDPAMHPRIANAHFALGLAAQDVRSMAVRFAPTVHGSGGDHGFIATLVAIAREKGVAGYVDEGSNRWPAVHRLDAAHLVRLAVDTAPAGSVLHATAEEGITARTIAETIGAGLGLPVASIPAEQADEHFGWIGRFFAADAPASSEKTQALLGWTPTHPTLLEDLHAGAYYG
jgi:nucleoside-diphosphate-sugar epimerase